MNRQIWSDLKVSKSKKQFMVSLMLPKTELEIKKIELRVPIFSTQTHLFLNGKWKKYIWVFFPLILRH